MKKQDAPYSNVISVLHRGKSIDWQQVLSDIITAFNCTTGTLHLFEKKSELLKLVAHQGIPVFLLPKVQEIPVGKGMAGIAAKRREPVEMCNLQTDSTGVARPAAKETKVEGSISVPILFSGTLYGTFGIAKPVAYEFSGEEVKNLLSIGTEIGKRISKL